MFLYALYALGGLIVAALGFAASKPDTFRIERSARMNASPDRIASNISDFHQWSAWSPWEKLDPDLKRTYSGASTGKGAVYDWTGNKKVGTGRMEVLDVQPGKVTIKLDFLKPFEAHNITEFSLAPAGGGTNVTWAMHGASPFVAKVFGLVYNMDKTVGADFERGLANLKQVAEGTGA
jgi:Polyketide cyclase / dehydrase and lipid transport